MSVTYFTPQEIDAYRLARDIERMVKTKSMVSIHCPLAGPIPTQGERAGMLNLGNGYHKRKHLILH